MTLNFSICFQANLRDTVDLESFSARIFLILRQLQKFGLQLSYKTLKLHLLHIYEMNESEWK